MSPLTIFPAHWLALEGVQPSIPQKPHPARTPPHHLPTGPRANQFLPALSGADTTGPNSTTASGSSTIKPLVKHILSRELQLYFSKVCSALLDPTNDEYRIAALASLRSDPGLHQLVPYFVQWVAEKVTHNLRDVWILNQMCGLIDALLANASLFVDPYVASLVPPILTCAISPLIGAAPATGVQHSLDHYPLRSLAASLLGLIASKYAKSSATLRPRLVRSFLKNFLDPRKPFPVHFGAVRGIAAVGGTECVRSLIVPNLNVYGGLLKEAMEGEGKEGKGKVDGEMVVGAILGALEMLLEEEGGESLLTNGSGNDEEMRKRLEEKIGEYLAGRVMREGRKGLVKAIVEA
jgi:transcription initiation factor TFIID subunit 6